MAVMQAMRQERYKNSSWENVESMEGDNEGSSDEETFSRKEGLEWAGRHFGGPTS